MKQRKWNWRNQFENKMDSECRNKKKEHHCSLLIDDNSWKQTIFKLFIIFSNCSGNGGDGQCVCVGEGTYLLINPEEEGGVEVTEYVIKGKLGLEPVVATQVLSRAIVCTAVAVPAQEVLPW